MMTTKTWFSRSLLISMLLSAAACGERHAVTVDLEGSVTANSAALDHIDWETSPHHPTKLFSKWRFDRFEAENICSALTKRSAHELTLFENEINDNENADLVAPCKAELRAKLDQYWKQHLTKTAKLSMNFRFSDVVETRDFSKGLYVTHMDLAPKRVLLTFDDGPHAEHTDTILRTMSQVNAKSVFFHMGRNVRRLPEIVKRVASKGHGVGSHSTTHQCLPAKTRCASNNGRMLSHSEALAEISGGHRAVQTVLGWVDPFFRFPYGESSPELKQFLRERRVGEFFWNIDSNDWRQQPPEQVVRTIMSTLQRQDHRGVILMHDIQRRTAEALPLLLKELYFGGYTPVILRPADAKARKNNLL